MIIFDMMNNMKDKPYVDKTEKCVHKEIPSVIYDEQKKQCVLIYKDTMIVRECK